MENLATLVAESILKGNPVMYWTDYESVKHLNGFVVNEDFDLKVVVLRKNPDSGIVVVTPKNPEAWDAYRKGKLQMISRTAKRPMTWAGRYFKAAQTVKSGLDPQVIRVVAKLRFPEISNLPCKTIREKAIKLIAVKLVQSRPSYKQTEPTADDYEEQTA